MDFPFTNCTVILFALAPWWQGMRVWDFYFMSSSNMEENCTSFVFFANQIEDLILNHWIELLIIGCGASPRNPPFTSYKQKKRNIHKMRNSKSYLSSSSLCTIVLYYKMYLLSNLNVVFVKFHTRIQLL